MTLSFFNALILELLISSSSPTFSSYSLLSSLIWKPLFTERILNSSLTGRKQNSIRDKVVRYRNIFFFIKRKSRILNQNISPKKENLISNIIETF